MDANSTSQQGLLQTLMHAGLMAHAAFTHDKYESQRLMAEQRRRDAINLEQAKSLYVLGLR